jgi:metal-responsive CopG/Arc/MetJ family transcriptional regulator
MPRQHIKVYINDEWLEVIKKAAEDAGSRSQSEFCRLAIEKELVRRKDVKKNQLPEIKIGRVYDHS